MAEPLACAVLGMRRLGPMFGDPVVVIGAGTMGLLLQLLLLARGRVPLPFTSGTSEAECPVFSVALRVGHDCCWRSGTAVNATRPLL